MAGTDLSGRSALVTGAAQGLGAGMAQALAAAGATVTVADVQTDLGRETAAALGEGHGFVELDVAEDAQWEAAIAESPLAPEGWTSWSTTPASRSPA